MSIGSIVTLGYASKEVDATDFIKQTFDVNNKALLIDTRLHPWCRWDERWQRFNLEERYRRRYLWKGDLLGNVNHDDPDLPIKLAHEEAGITWLVKMIEQGATLLLLCACGRYDRCHRKVIYELVIARLGARLPLFALDQRVLTPYGAGKIDPHVPLDVHQARNRYAVILDVWRPQRYYSPEELQPFDVVQQRLSA